MKKILSLIIIFWINVSLIHAGIAPTRLRCEYLDNPQVIDLMNPRLSWVNIADELHLK